MLTALHCTNNHRERTERKSDLCLESIPYVFQPGPFHHTAKFAYIWLRALPNLICNIDISKDQFMWLTRGFFVVDCTVIWAEMSWLLQRSMRPVLDTRLILRVSCVSLNDTRLVRMVVKPICDMTCVLVYYSILWRE
jgi:hypothetical protein